MPGPLVLFDVNETLVSLAGLDPRFAAAGQPPGARERWLAATLRDGIALAASGAFAPFAEVGRGVLVAMLGDEDAADEILAGLPELALHDDIAPATKRLRERGWRIAALTNGDAEQAEGWLEQGGVLEAFEEVLSVDEAGRWKPAPQAYAWALERLGAEAAQTTLVAVHPWDVHGAQRVGLRGAWVAREGEPYPPAFGRPDVQAPGMVELAAAL